MPGRAGGVAPSRSSPTRRTPGERGPVAGAARRSCRRVSQGPHPESGRAGMALSRRPRRRDPPEDGSPAVEVAPSRRPSPAHARSQRTGAAAWLRQRTSGSGESAGLWTEGLESSCPHRSGREREPRRRQRRVWRARRRPPGSAQLGSARGPRTRRRCRHKPAPSRPGSGAPGSPGPQTRPSTGPHALPLRRHRGWPRETTTRAAAALRPPRRPGGLRWSSRAVALDKGYAALPLLQREGSAPRRCPFAPAAQRGTHPRPCRLDHPHPASPKHPPRSCLIEVCSDASLGIGWSLDHGRTPRKGWSTGSFRAVAGGFCGVSDRRQLETLKPNVGARGLRAAEFRRGPDPE
jgi:hypothetical protein